MNRRHYLATIGSISLAGCVNQIAGQSDSKCSPSLLNTNPRTRPCPVLTHQPTKPTVGQATVLDASESQPPPERFGSSETLFYFWRVGPNTQVSVPEGAEYVTEGPQFTHRFNEAGRHTVEVLITHGNNIVYSDEAFPNIGVGYQHESDVARASEIVNVQPLPEDPIDLDNTDVTISLKAEQQAVSIDNPAYLTLSITNTIGDGPVSAQLILEVPTGLTVSETSFNQGGGQYTSTFEIDPGDTANERIAVRATESGPYQLTGYVVYEFDESDTTEQTQTSEIQLRFYE